ncbi:jg1887, partial [Pararge aegeria aegeria]
TKKFSVPMAQEAIERYILLRQSWGIAFNQLDYMLPVMTEIIDLGYIFVSPYKDKLGRRVVIYRPGVFDPYKYTNQDMCRVMAMCYETLMEDEETQVRGLVHYADGSGVSFPHLTLFTPKEAVRIVKNGEVRLIKVIGPYYYKLFIIIISLTTNHCTARMGRRQLCPRGKDKNVSSPTALSTLRALAHKWK